MSGSKLLKIWKLLIGLLILKVTLAVVAGYVNYFPANLNSDFLRGREGHFFGSYQWAFYAHIVSGPISLLLGLVLISRRFRNRFPAWHRRLGRVQALCTLFLTAPSGLFMAAYSSSGPTSGISFAMLALLTGGCTALGWRAAVRRRFASHERWMRRSFVLLCSAVVLRLIGGLGSVLQLQWNWIDPVASWASWMLPLAVNELAGILRNRRIAVAAFRKTTPIQSIASAEMLLER